MKISIPSTAERDLYKAEGRQLTHGRSYRVPVHSEFDKMVIGAREIAVLVATMVAMFDFESNKKSMGGKAQNAKGGGFDHNKLVGNELTIDRRSSPTKLAGHGRVSKQGVRGTVRRIETRRANSSLITAIETGQMNN